MSRTPCNNSRPCDTVDVARSSRNQPFGLMSVPFESSSSMEGTRRRLHAFRSPRH
jgi:hypothetical protein